MHCTHHVVGLIILLIFIFAIGQLRVTSALKSIHWKTDDKIPIESEIEFLSRLVFHMLCGTLGDEPENTIGRFHGHLRSAVETLSRRLTTDDGKVRITQNSSELT